MKTIDDIINCEKAKEKLREDALADYVDKEEYLHKESTLATPVAIGTMVYIRDKFNLTGEMINRYKKEHPKQYEFDFKGGSYS